MHILGINMIFSGWCKHLSGAYSLARTLSSTPPPVGPHDQSYALGWLPRCRPNCPPCVSLQLRQMFLITRVQYAR